MMNLDFAGKGKYFGYAVLLVSIVYVLFLAFYADQFGASVQQNGNIWFGLLVYFIAQPTYVMIILGLPILRGGDWGRKFRSFIAGVFIVLASDAVSLPHCLPMSGLPTESNLYLCSDTLFARGLLGATPEQNIFSIFWFAYYVVVPIALLGISFWLLGEQRFTSKIQSMGKVA